MTGQSWNALGESLWTSLPVPAFLVDGSDVIADANPAAEQFLNISARHVRGAPLWDRLSVDAELETVAMEGSTIISVPVTTINANGL